MRTHPALQSGNAAPLERRAGAKNANAARQLIANVAKGGDREIDFSITTAPSPERERLMTVNVEVYREVSNLASNHEAGIHIEPVMNPGVQPRGRRLQRERSELRFARREKMAEDIGRSAGNARVV